MSANSRTVAVVKGQLSKFSGTISKDADWGTRMSWMTGALPLIPAMDPGDIRKKYAAKMEGLCKIHDGSEHEIGERSWFTKAVAADIDQKKVIPLYSEAYSQKAGGFIRENDQLFKVIDTITKTQDIQLCFNFCDDEARSKTQETPGNVFLVHFSP